MFPGVTSINLELEKNYAHEFTNSFFWKSCFSTFRSSVAMLGSAMFCNGRQPSRRLLSGCLTRSFESLLVESTHL